MKHKIGWLLTGTCSREETSLHKYQKTKADDSLEVCYSLVHERENKIVEVIGLGPKMLTDIYLVGAIKTQS